MWQRIGTILISILVFVVIALVVYFVWTQFFDRETEISVGSTVKLECTTDCQDHGQCGTNVDTPNNKVVLAGSNGPTVEKDQHDRSFPAGAEVTIKETRSEMLQQENGRQFSQQFSRVEWRNTINDIQNAGWVADWCIK